MLHNIESLTVSLYNLVCFLKECAAVVKLFNLIVTEELLNYNTSIVIPLAIEVHLNGSAIRFGCIL
jgi:hypothetical protein